MRIRLDPSLPHKKTRETTTAHQRVTTMPPVEASLTQPPFKSNVGRGTTSNTRKSHKRKEQKSFEINGKKADTKNTPEPDHPYNTEHRFLENDTEDQNGSVGELIKKMEEQ